MFNFVPCTKKGSDGTRMECQKESGAVGRSFATTGASGGDRKCTGLRALPGTHIGAGNKAEIEWLQGTMALYIICVFYELLLKWNLSGVFFLINQSQIHILKALCDKIHKRNTLEFLFCCCCFGFLSEIQPGLCAGGSL